MKEEEQRWVSAAAPAEKRRSLIFPKKAMTPAARGNSMFLQVTEEAEEEDSARVRHPFLKKGEGSAAQPYSQSKIRLKGVHIVGHQEMAERLANQSSVFMNLALPNTTNVGTELPERQLTMNDSISKLLMQNIKAFKDTGAFELGVDLMRRIANHKIDDIILDYLFAKQVLTKEQLLELHRSYTKRTRFIKTFHDFFKKLRQSFLKNSELAFQLLSSQLDAVKYLLKLSNSRGSSKEFYRPYGHSTSVSTLIAPALTPVIRGGAKKRKPANLSLSTTSISFHPSKNTIQLEPLKGLRFGRVEDFTAYYTLKIGNPLKVASIGEVYCTITPRPELAPSHVLQAGYRYHVDLRVESDAAWIFYLMLLLPPPPSCEGFSNLYLDSKVTSYIQWVLSKEAGDFPGDDYFQKLLSQIRFRRTQRMQYMTEEERGVYLLNASWLHFILKGMKKEYKHNFYTNKTEYVTA
jgi:hypothetical protein